MFLGVPFNITSYALLLALAAKATGYDPGQLTMFLADVHIYANHLDQVDEQLARGPRFRPELLVTNLKHPDWRSVEWLSRIEPDEISLKNYDPHPPIKAEMAV
jgi:thymidylate synthase